MRDEAFLIDSSTGVIYIGSGSLDRETRTLYNLTATAVDGGGRMVSRATDHDVTSIIKLFIVSVEDFYERRVFWDTSASTEKNSSFPYKPS